MILCFDLAFILNFVYGEQHIRRQVTARLTWPQHKVEDANNIPGQSYDRKM